MQEQILRRSFLSIVPPCKFPPIRSDKTTLTLAREKNNDGSHAQVIELLENRINTEQASNDNVSSELSQLEISQPNSVAQIN